MPDIVFGARSDSDLILVDVGPIPVTIRLVGDDLATSYDVEPVTSDVETPSSVRAAQRTAGVAAGVRADAGDR